MYLTLLVAYGAVSIVIQM